MKQNNYSDAVAISAEGERIGLVHCLQCGAAVLLDSQLASVEIHEEWHKQIQGRLDTLPAKPDKYEKD